MFCSELIPPCSRRPCRPRVPHIGNKSGNIEGDIQVDFQKEAEELFPKQTQPEPVNIITRELNWLLCHVHAVVYTRSPLLRRGNKKSIDLRHWHRQMLIPPTEKNVGAPHNPSRDHPQSTLHKRPGISQRTQPAGPSLRQEC